MDGDGVSSGNGNLRTLTTSKNHPTKIDRRERFGPNPHGSSSAMIGTEACNFLGPMGTPRTRCCLLTGLLVRYQNRCAVRAILHIPLGSHYHWNLMPSSALRSNDSGTPRSSLVSDASTLPSITPASWAILVRLPM